MDGTICGVTGSTQGLGVAISPRLADANGRDLITLARNKPKGRAMAEIIPRETRVNQKGKMTGCTSPGEA